MSGLAGQGPEQVLLPPPAAGDPAVAELNALVEREFPLLPGHTVRSLRDGVLSLDAGPGDLMLRPGDTVAGPDQMRVLDLSGYLLLKHLVGLDSSILLRNISMSLLRAPAPGTLTSAVSVLSRGTRMAEIRGDLHDESGHLVSTALLTFSFRKAPDGS
ncbi:hypothetical protein C3486_14890 [Streptomyces sp. Ru73]|uniref:PaaI family thioesterase n=1 Tax=Streptomyces sp. Ru73 TaxID=2080748 RepID=UPI000CDDED5E|nr:PaaI family thioesterase [Streptomyces sp. Ru73]POX40226.1 hypothetical protein C3486_14890 [Streptomyces sp. Ru73]